MSNYNQQTNFSLKDSLADGDTQKIIRGSEINDELNAISTAIATKADIRNPTFEQTVNVPLVAAGDDSQLAASTSFVNLAISNAITALALGDIVTQNKDAIDITGGTIVDATVNNVIVGTNASGTKTISTADPTAADGVDGDIWYKVSA